MDTESVSGIACPCPDTPHADGDTVELRKRLDTPGGIRLQNLVIAANAANDDNAKLLGRLAEAYLLIGVVGWTFRDKKGAVPVNEENIRRLLVDDFERGYPVADKADDLYLGPVLGPLVATAQKSSPTTPTGGSTSATSNGSRKHPKRSKPSSTSTTPTDVTVPTGP